MNDGSRPIGPATLYFSRPHCDVEIFSEGDRTIIRGYAAKFGTYSEDLGGFRTTLEPTAFDRVLSSSADVRLLVNHDPNILLGRTTAGTLTLAADGTGLRFEGNPPRTVLADHHVESIRRGDLTGCSFSCDIDIDEWDWSGATPIRTVKNISALYDVGPVAYPAFKDTNVSVSKYALESARAAAAADEERGRNEEASRRARRSRALFLMVSLGP